MGDVSRATEKYIAEYIRLSRQDISSSARSREWFLTRIENVINARTKEPVLYKPRFVYFGSYFKGTKVQVVDEYDVLVVIDSNTGIFSSGGKPVGQGRGVASPNYKYEYYKKADTSGVSPSKMLAWLKSVVKEVTDAYGGDAPIRNGQAITAEIKSQNLKIDLVPAGIFTRSSDNSTFYNIPNGKQNDSWIVTSPEVDMKALDDVASGKSNFKNVIRIIKRIRDTYNFLVPSFAIEAAVVEYGAVSQWYNVLHLDLLGSLAHLSTKFREGKIDDPYDSTKNLVDSVDSLEWYADRITHITDVLIQCQNLNNQEKMTEKVINVFENT